MYEGYMTYGGVEIVNSARAKVYAENGLVPSSVTLNCGCDSIAEATGATEYTSVIIDQPPWYDPTDPYPNDFAGVVPLEVTGLTGSTRKVEVLERLGDGGIPIRGRAASRTIAVTAALVGRSTAGLDAGINWLSATLHPPCVVSPAGCGGETLQMFAACPETCEGQTDPDALPVTSGFLVDDLQPLGGDITGGSTPVARHNLITAPSFELQSGGEGTAPDGWTGFNVGQNGTITYTQVGGDGVTSQNYAIDFYADAQGYGGPGAGGNMIDDPGFEVGLGDWVGVNGASLSQFGNVLSSEDSGFEGGTTGGWAAGGVEAPAIANDTTRAYLGTHALRITWAAGTFFPQVGHTGNIPVTVGLTYTASAWVFIPTGAPNLTIMAGGQVGPNSDATRRNRWEQITATFTAQAGTADIQFIASGDLSNIAGTQCWVDDISLTPLAPHGGSEMLQITWPTGGIPAASIPQTGFTIGDAYTFSAWVYVPSGHPPVKLQVFGVTTGPESTATDMWSLISVTWIADDTTQNLQVVASEATTAGQVCYVDDVFAYGGYPAWDFDGGTNGWTGANGASVVATDQPGSDGVLPHNSANMLAVTWPDGGFPAAQVVLEGLTPGQPYTFTAWLYCPVGNVDVTVSVWLIGEAPPMTAKTVWTQVQMSFVASATSHVLQVVPKGTHAAGEVCYVDDVYVTAGTYTFTDGFGLTTDVSATPGQTYFGSVDLTLVNLPGGHDAALYLIPRTAGGTALASFFATGDPWVHQQTLTVSPFTAPANTDHIEVSLRLYGNGGGWEITQPVEVKWDSVMLAEGSVMPYFDGASTDTGSWTYTWDGAANASASTATAVTSAFTEFVAFDPHQNGSVSTPTLSGVCDLATVTWDLVNTADYPISVYATVQDSPGQVVISEPQIASHGVADVLNPTALDGWFSDLDNRDNTPANIVFIGDSVTEGLMAGTYAAGFQRLFTRRAQDRYNVTHLQTPGAGWIPAVNIAPASPTTLAGAPTLDDTSGAGLGVKALRVETGQSVTWPQTWCDQIRVMYSHAAANAGRGTISIDGLDVGTIQSAAAADAGGVVWDSGPLAPGPHIMSIRGLDADPVILSGAEFFYGDAGKGIHVYDSGHSGAGVDMFAGAGSETGHWDDFQAIQPNVTVINLGLNGDWTQSAQRLADLDTTIGRCDARSDRGDGRGPRPVVLVIPYRPVHPDQTPQEEAGFDAFCEGIRARAVGHIAVYDLRAHWPILVAGQGWETGVMYEDDYPLHPNPAGHDLLADLMLDAIAPEQVTIYGSSLPVGGGTTISVTVDPTPGFPNDWTSTLHTTGDVQFNVTLTARPEIALEDCVDPLIRTYRNVVTVAGPVETARYADRDGEVVISTVEWTMVAGEPYPFGVETPMVVSVDSEASATPSYTAPGVITTARQSIDDAATVCEVPAPPTVYCNDDPAWMGLPAPPTYPAIVDTTAPEVIDYWRRTVQFPNPPGVAALMLVITSDAQAKKGLRVRVWHEDDCDLAMPVECAFDYEFTIDYLPPDSTLVIDSASGTATATCPDGSLADHTRNLRGNYGGPFLFPVVGCGDCTRIAVDVPKTYVSGGQPGLTQGGVVWSAYIAHRMG